MVGAEEGSHRAVTHGLWALDLHTRRLHLKSRRGASWVVQSICSKKRSLTLAAFACANRCLSLKSTNFGATRFISGPVPALTSGELLWCSRVIYGVEMTIVIIIEIFEFHATWGTPRRARLKSWLPACFMWTVGTELMLVITATLRCCFRTVNIKFRGPFGFFAREYQLWGPSLLVHLGCA